MKKQLLTLALALISGFGMSLQAQTYCSAGPSSTADSEITGVALVGDNYSISKSSSSCGTAGVQNFTATDSADVSQGTSYVISVTMGTCGGSYAGAIAAWIDFNGDGDFVDAGEKLGSYGGSPTSTQQFSFTVPSTATLGQTRLRVMQQEGGNAGLISPCNTFTWGAVEDYRINITNTPPACGTPANLVVTTGVTTAELGWDAVSSALYYIVEYDTAGFTVGTGDTAWVYSDTASLTGLMASTSYDFYVKSVCSTASSNSISQMGVYTQCAAFVTPYTENFDGGASGSYTNASMPQCWGYTSTTTYPYWYVHNYSTYANSGTQMVYGYKSSGTPNGTSYGDTAFFSTPVTQGLDSATKQVEFYARTSSTSYQGMVIIGLCDANATMSSFHAVDTIYATTAYDKYTVYFDAASGVASGDARVAFAWIYDGGYDYVYIDDITVSDIPPCPEPIGLSLVGTTQTTGTISWSSSSSAFNIEVGPMGFTQGTGTAATSSTNSYTATGLTQNTYYDVYVMSNCTSTGDGTSNWVGPFTFKTECGDQAVPYTTSFEASASGTTTNPNLPDCWEYAKTGASTSLYGYVYNSATYATTGVSSFRMYGYSSTTSTTSAAGDTLAAFSPRIAGLNGSDKQVIFNVRGSSSSNYYPMRMIIATADSNASLGSISIVDTVMYSTVYQEFTVDLDNVSSDASRVVFMMIPYMNSGTTYSYSYAYLDDIEIRDIPNCPIALNAMGNATSDSSATLSWTDSSLVNSYIIEYGPCGFTQGTGAPMDTVTGNSWSVSNLVDATCYDFYIQSDCMTSNGSMSPWVGPITINVPCSPTTVPFADGFETAPAYSGGNGNPNLPACWAYDGTNGTSYSMAYGYNYYAYSGDYSLYNYMYSGGGDTNVISTPMIANIDQGGNVLKFWAKTNSTSYPGGFNVVMTDAMGNYETARIIKTFNLGGNTTYQQFQVYLDSNTVEAGDQRVGFMMYSKASSYDYVFIDSVEIEAMPTCINYNQMATNMTDSSADLTWMYTGTNCFNIEYGLTGFIQGTGTGAQAGTTVSSVTAPYTLTGLSPNTTYDFYIESCCNQGQWEGPFTFTTECTGPLASGTYSVGATGDFATLDSVLSVLNVCGIAGPVTFEFQSGSFYASSPIGAVNGASATNTITFKGSAATNDTINGGLVLQGTSYLNLEDLYIRSTTGYTLRFNHTSHINVTGCDIEAALASSSSVVPIVFSKSSTSYSSTTDGEEYITISGNNITGGYMGLTMYGSSGNLSGYHDIEISNNTFSSQYYYGVYAYYGSNYVISGNTMSGFTYNYNYAAYLYNIDGCQVTGNTMNSYYALYASYVGTATSGNIDSEISNNMINNSYYGLRVYYGSNLGVYHNTAVGSYYGLYDYYNGSTVEFVNNIFQGGTYALYSYYSTAFHDYNVYYSKGTNLGYIYNGSANYPTDSASLVAVDTTQNTHSWVGDPIFASASDLHVYGPLANDHGDNTVGISVDIDGDARPMSGSTTVDIGADEYDVIGEDAALIALLSPSNGVCGNDSLLVTVEIGNFGQNTLTSVTVSADVLGTTLSQTVTGLSIPFGGRDTVELGYVSNYVGGSMSVVAYTTLTNDGRPFNDTLSTSVTISDAQQVAVSYPAMVCAGDDVSMIVSHPAEGTALWTSGNDTIALASVDSTITITNLTADTTITVGTVSTETTIATPAPQYTWSGLDGVYFTLYQGATVDTVSIYPSTTSGTENVVVIDAGTGATVFSTDVTWSIASAPSEARVAIGASLSPGNYLLKRNGATTGSWYDLYVGTGATGYPFWSTDSNAVLTSGTYASYIEYFFNWKFTVGGCDREDTTFTVSIAPAPVADITVDTANAVITATDWTATWDASGTTDADSIMVYFDNGDTAYTATGSVTYAANQGATATVIAYGMCSTDTMTFSFDVNQISVDENFMNGTLSIYPNPTRGLFNVEFATTSAKDVEISIVNMVGQVISTDVVKVNGAYANQFDLSGQAAGVYFIKFTTDEGVLTERITVE
jgi:parallel beta-helix repeat protein